MPVEATREQELYRYSDCPRLSVHNEDQLTDGEHQSQPDKRQHQPVFGAARHFKVPCCARHDGKSNNEYRTRLSDSEVRTSDGS